MRNLTYTLRAVPLLASILCGIARGEAPPPVRFSRDILPILSGNCFQCHGPDERARKAKLRLDREDGVRRVVVPGNPEESELVRRVLSADQEEVMPPRRSNRALSSAQKEALRRWVEQGAPW